MVMTSTDFTVVDRVAALFDAVRPQRLSGREINRGGEHNSPQEEMNI
jgi:hypothetical protein